MQCMENNINLLNLFNSSSLAAYSLKNIIGLFYK